MRVDHNFSNSDTFFGRYTVDESHHNPLNFPTFTIGITSLSQFMTLSENHIFSPTVINTFRASFSRTGFVTSRLSTSDLSFVTGQPTGGLTIGQF